MVVVRRSLYWTSVVVYRLSSVSSWTRSLYKSEKTESCRKMLASQWRLLQFILTLIWWKPDIAQPLLLLLLKFISICQIDPKNPVCALRSFNCRHTALTAATRMTLMAAKPATRLHRPLHGSNGHYLIPIIWWSQRGSDGCDTACTDKKKTKFSSYLSKSRKERLQSHIQLTASSYMTKYLRIPSYIRKPFLIYDFATAPILISLYVWKIFFSFLSV